MTFSPRYQFHEMTADDLPAVRRWVSMPHVIPWCGDPDEQYALITEDMIHPAMDQFIVSLDGRPFAYIQCYALTEWSQGFGDHPERTRGIDQFIGEFDMMERGHGSAFIRQFTDEQFARGIPRMLLDPNPDNGRAIRAYEKAGFQRDRLVDTPDGVALLMVRNP